MAIKKDPAKPGYMSTELWAMVSYGLYTFGSKVGLSPEETEDLVSSIPQIIQEYLGDNPIVSIVFGAIILYYTKSRTKIKTAEIYANAKMEMVKEEEKDK